jgi:hypothetical protein
MVSGAFRAAALNTEWLLKTRTETPKAGRRRHYVASATVLLLGVPVFSRTGVGEGYASIDECLENGERRWDVEFGAGSFPDKAHGLNKLGFIRESVMETQNGVRTACAYFGFMTTSQEKNLDEAKNSLAPSGETATYSVGCGSVTNDGVDGQTLRINLSSRYNWRDFASIAREVRTAVSALPLGLRTPLDPQAGIPATFLNAVRSAMSNPTASTEELLIFNGKYYVLRTEKQRDAAMSAQLAKQGVVQSADRIVRLNGTLIPKHAGEKTNFRIWFERGSHNAPPLRFDYQARSFLRLSFEANGTGSATPLNF